MQLTREEYVQRIIDELQSGNADEQTDGTGPKGLGQLVIYTNVFLWSDYTYHTEPEEVNSDKSVTPRRKK